jgi:hypothetical protein
MSTAAGAFMTSIGAEKLNEKESMKAGKSLYITGTVL